jgi:hypothetical protein
VAAGIWSCVCRRPFTPSLTWEHSPSVAGRAESPVLAGLRRAASSAASSPMVIPNATGAVGALAGLSSSVSPSGRVNDSQAIALACGGVADVNAIGDLCGAGRFKSVENGHRTDTRHNRSADVTPTRQQPIGHHQLQREVSDLGP